MFHLKVGDKAPEFDIKDQNGKVHKIADYQGKKVILYFYPKDMTPGCTVQSCDLRDNYESLIAAGFEVIGVSADDEAKHQKFIAKHNLPFNLFTNNALKMNLSNNRVIETNEHLWNWTNSINYKSIITW